MRNNSQGSSKIPAILLSLALIGLAAWTLYSQKDEPAGLAGNPTPEQAQVSSGGMRVPVTVALTAQNDSGQDGTVTFNEVNGQTEVTINVNPGPAGVKQPAHIHAGSCAGGLGIIRYDLNPVVDGHSTTTLAPVLHFIHGLGEIAVNIHKAPTGPDVYAACADLGPAFDAAMEPVS